MSRSTRQSAFILSLVESLALTVQQAVQDQPRQKGKYEIAQAVVSASEALQSTFPLNLGMRQGKKVIDALGRFQKLQNRNKTYHQPEVLVAMGMVLMDHLFSCLKNKAKVELVSRLSQAVNELYLTFDRQVGKRELMEEGCRLGEELLTWGI